VLIDTHVHLQHPHFEPEAEAVLERGRAAGVRRFVCPGYDLPSSRAAVELAMRHPDVVAAAGVHPHDSRFYDDATEAAFDAWLASGAAVAAGEMGLDYHYDHSPRDVQRDVLRRQLRLARRHRVPVILHNRASDDDMAAILQAEAADLCCVLHAFDGTPILADLGRRSGLYFGIGGFLTFKKHRLADIVRDLPRDALLLETDAPYLSPHPMRGKRNEPAYVRHVAEHLAALLGLDVDTLVALTAENATRFLGGKKPVS
jgi:TatD DNase family protein